MEISVNDELREVTNNTTVQRLLEEIGTNAKGVAVAKNNEVIPRDSWSTVQFQEGDKVVIIQATQGG